MRRRQLLAGIPLVSSLSALAQTAPTPVEGKDFTRLASPQPVSVPGKIEVMEFFSYACPHCNAFEPVLASWVSRLPPHVAFKRIPVSFLPNVENFQRTYYALESLGLVEAVQAKIFFAVHTERQRLAKLEDVAAVVSRSGGDGERFLAACRSFSVAVACNRATKMTADFGVASYPGVPSLAIQGRYLTSPDQAGSGPKALAVCDYLIQKARGA